MYSWFCKVKKQDCKNLIYSAALVYFQGKHENNCFVFKGIYFPMKAGFSTRTDALLKRGFSPWIKLIGYFYLVIKWVKSQVL